MEKRVRGGGVRFSEGNSQLLGKSLLKPKK
jgi:hypothetical protein